MPSALEIRVAVLEATLAVERVAKDEAMRIATKTVEAHLELLNGERERSREDRDAFLRSDIYYAAEKANTKWRQDVDRKFAWWTGVGATLMVALPIVYAVITKLVSR